LSFSSQKEKNMLVVRDIFQLHFGKAREALELLKEIKPHMDPMGFPAFRILTDYVGADYYTLILESEAENLAAFETMLTKETQNPEWRAWYAKFSLLARSGRREVLRVMQ
jgi:hypothetical protein